jgi:hypothetical protein
VESSWLWKESNLSDEINELTQKYEVIKYMRSIVSFTSFVSYDTAFDHLRDAVTEKNKLPRTLINTAVPSLSTFLSAIANNGATSDIRDGLALDTDIIKALFFDITKAKSVELLKQRLDGIAISNSDLLNIYNGLAGGFSHDENVFLSDVRAKVEEFAKGSVALKIKENWNRLTDADTPSAWALANGIPARFALGEAPEAGDLVAVVESPEKFSAYKLGELLTIISGLSPVDIEEIQARFIAEVVPRRFAKFNINLSSLLEFLKGKYGTQPNNWSSRLDIHDFIISQYVGTFAPQVAEKIKKTSADDLKTRLIELAQKNPDLGLLFWE